MSCEQWAGMLLGDESYAGARSWYRLQNVLTELTGMAHILPTHQGRASERILFTLIGGADKVIPNNSHFDTTRANIENTGAAAIDLVIDEAYEPDKPYPFKGNMDIKKLQALIKEVGAEKIPLCMVTITNNNIGGQPVSMANLKEVKRVCVEHNIPFFLDACRFAENAYFIKQKEKKYANLSVREIVRLMFDLADGATISAKKDGLVNIGGLLLLRNNELAQKANNLLILTEGFTTYGGLAGRDLEAMAQGFVEAIDEDYLRYRMRSVEYLAEHLLKAGIPIVQPVGGHAVYIDAKAFCAHIPPKQFPGQALVCALYRTAGIRATELGSVVFGKKNSELSKQNKNLPPVMELVRLAIPRRVYTQSHMDYVAEALQKIYNDRKKLKGLEIIEEPETLRHFTAKFKEID
jgi:tryptophanase